MQITPQLIADCTLSPAKQDALRWVARVPSTMRCPVVVTAGAERPTYRATLGRVEVGLLWLKQWRARTR